MASFNPSAVNYAYGDVGSYSDATKSAQFPPPTASQRIYSSPVKASTPGVSKLPNRTNGTWTSPPPNVTTTRPSPQPSPISSELTSTAAPFIPKQQLLSPQQSAEPLVQVTRGGCIFYVPESEANSNSATGTPHAALHVDIHSTTNPTTPSSSVNPSSYGNKFNPALTICGRPIVATRRSLASLALAPSIRRQLDQQHEEMIRQVDPSDERYKEIPSQFVCMWPLDAADTPAHRNIAGSFGYPSHSYKVLSETDGRTYALRRIENVRTTPAIVQQAVDTWKRVTHASLVPLHRAFVSHGALFFLCEFYPGAISAHQKYLASNSVIASESFLWSLLTQVCAALRVVHGAQLACKGIHPRRLLITANDRVRITGLGVLDVLEYDSLKSKVRVDSLQKDDLVSLGKTVLSIASRRDWHPSTQNESLAEMQKQYSPALCQLVEQLIDQTISTVAALSIPLQDSMFQALDQQYRLTDEYEHQLAAEYQNGRMLLLLMKLGLVNERPELNQDRSWAETGDRYLLQLFRDYVFHQVDESNRPVIDFGHVVDCLNKLDSAAQEKILLSSRDGQSILVASYAEVHRCVQQTFSELLTAAQRRPVHITPVAKNHHGGAPLGGTRGRGGRSNRGRGRGRGSEH